MPQYIPREETRGINAPNLNTGVVASKVPAQTIPVAKHIDASGGFTWSNAFSAMAAGIDKLAQNVGAVEDDKIKEESVKVQIAGQMGDPYDTRGDRRLEKAFAQGEAVRDLRTWSLAQQTALSGELASLPPEQAAAHINESYSAKRKEYMDRGDTRGAYALDQYAVELLPQLTNVHGKAYEAHTKYKAGESLSSDMSLDIQAVNTGELSPEQFTKKYTQYALKGVYGLDPVATQKALAASVQGMLARDLEGLRDDPNYKPQGQRVLGLLKEMRLNPDDPYSSLYYRSAISGTLQQSEAAFVQAQEGQLTQDKMNVLFKFHQAAENGTLNMGEMFNANQTMKLNMSMSSMVSLAAHNAKNQNKGAGAQAVIQAMVDGNIAVVAGATDKDRKLAEKELLARAAWASNGDADAQFRMLIPMYQNGMTFDDVRTKNDMAVSTVPTSADGKPNPHLEQVLRDYRVARQMGLGNLEGIFGSALNIEKLDELMILTDNGADLGSAWGRVNEAFSRDRAATKEEARRILYANNGINEFIASQSASGWLDSGNKLRDPRARQEFERLSVILLSTGGMAGDANRAMKAAWRQMSDRTETVNGEMVFRPANMPNLKQAVGVRSTDPKPFEDVFNNYIANMGASARGLFPEFAEGLDNWDPKRISIRVNSNGQSVRLIYRGEQGVYMANQELPIADIGLHEARNNAALAELGAIEHDANMQGEIQRMDRIVTNQLAASAVSAWQEIPELHGVNAAQWAAFSDKDKFRVIRSWQARKLNAQIDTLNEQRAALGLSLHKRVEFAEDLTGDDKWSKTHWSVTSKESKLLHDAPNWRRDVENKTWLSNEQAAVQALGLPSSYQAQLWLTRAVESDNGRLRKQVRGPAVGIYQAEPPTISDLMRWTAQREPAKFKALAQMAGPAMRDEFDALERAVASGRDVYKYTAPDKLVNAVQNNDLFAAGLAAMHYWRYVGDKMPEDTESRIQLHIKEYNRGGKANRAHSIRALQAHGFQIQ